MMEQHLRYLIELSFLDPGSLWSVMGPYEKEAEALLLASGHRVGSQPCDGIIAVQASSQTEDVLSFAAASLRKGGKLLLSDVTGNILSLLGLLRTHGFAVRHMEDLSQDFSACLSQADHTYILLVCERM